MHRRFLALFLAVTLLAALLVGIPSSVIAADYFELAEPPVSQNVLVNTSVTFSVMIIGGEEPIRYQWQTGTSEEGTYSNISGATSAVYTFNSGASASVAYYRCVITDSSTPP